MCGRGLASSPPAELLAFVPVSVTPTRELADGKLLIDEPAAGVLRLTISNPAKRNALDHPILDAISATLEDLGSSPARSAA